MPAAARSLVLELCWQIEPLAAVEFLPGGEVFRQDARGLDHDLGGAIELRPLLDLRQIGRFERVQFRDHAVGDQLEVAGGIERVDANRGLVVEDDLGAGRDGACAELEGTGRDQRRGERQRGTVRRRSRHG